MSNSSSTMAYPDVKKVFEDALTSSKGVRLMFKDKPSAFRFLSRCNSFRLLDRKENAKIFPEPAHTLHGRSVYDVLVLKQDDVFVTIVPIKADDLQVEFL